MPRAVMHRTTKDKHERREALASRIASSSTSQGTKNNPKTQQERNSAAQPGTLTINNHVATYPRHVEEPHLLALPGEIKNIIFHMVFQTVAIAMNMESQIQGYDGALYSNVWVRSGGRNRRLKCEEYHLRNALIYTCKRLYEEAMPILYERTAFTFQTAKELRRFLKHSPKIGIAAIQYLGICQLAYGEPTTLQMAKWRKTSDRTWSTLYKEIGARMVSLRNIALDIEVRQWPLSTGMHEDWVRRIEQVGTSKFTNVVVNVYHPLWNSETCTKMANNLEDALVKIPATLNDNDFLAAVEVLALVWSLVRKGATGNPRCGTSQSKAVKSLRIIMSQLKI